MKSRPRASWPVLSALAMTLFIAGAATAQVDYGHQDVRGHQVRGHFGGWQHSSSSAIRLAPAK